MSKLAVVALGGNALLRSGQKCSYHQQIENVASAVESLLKLIDLGYNLVIGHGNGPQVGYVLLQHEAANRLYEMESMPMDFCVAETQGSIGYLIEMGLRNALNQHQIHRNVLSLITQVLVDKDDPMFENPTKPIGPYYSEQEVAELLMDTPDAKYKEDPKGNGWRKVVASPKPIEVMNADVVKQLATAGNIVITVGGGGIPVIKENGMLKGVEAVIDKDLASALMADAIQADEFYILTDVPKIYINFNKPNQQALDVLTIAEAKKLLAEGQFTEGSMAPKVRAAIYFVENGGTECIITEANSLGTPGCGTRIVR